MERVDGMDRFGAQVGDVDFLENLPAKDVDTQEKAEHHMNVNNRNVYSRVDDYKIFKY